MRGNTNLNRRLKVLFITAWYPTKDTPVEGIFVREHAKAVRLYDDVVVLHCSGPDIKIKGLWRIEEEKDPSLTEGIPTYRVCYSLLPLTRESYLIYLYSVFRAFRWLARRGFRPDVIHAHVYRAGVPAVFTSKLYHIPVVVTEHWSAFPRKLLGRKEVLKARFAFQEAKMVFPVSKALQRSIEAYGIKAHFVIAPNAVDTNLFYPNPLPKRQDNFKRLLFVGNLVPVKGMPYLFRALAQLLQKQDDWHLDIVGDGPARSEYESMVKKLGLEDKVTFHGLKFKPEVAEFMRQADLFVLSSVWDNLPCVLAEAMTCGLPIVATDVGGIPEMVDTESGILAKPKDPDSIATAIERALENISVFNRQQIAHKAFERYGYQRVGETLHELYQSIFRLR